MKTDKGEKLKRAASFVVAVLIGMLVFLGVPSMVNAGYVSFADDPEAWAAYSEEAILMVWILICTALVFFMQAGFAMVEAGMSRTKNVVNVLMKNIVDIAAGSLAFFAIGGALLMGTDMFGLIGTDGFFLSGGWDMDSELLMNWLFSLVFCATAATIVSGAIAERTKFSVYIIFSVVISALIYPIMAHWVWGGGWLAEMGAIDFAGSGVVHATGAYVALAACIVIGPRIGRFSADGKPNAMLGHNMSLATLGMFILWFGWFGFNCGSTLVYGAITDAALVGVNTMLSAATGAMVACLVTWVKFGKPDITMTLNGAIGGLVGITAGAGLVYPWASVVIGAVAGLIVIYGYLFLESKGIDDVVGAIPVHGFSGSFGVLATGIFAQYGAEGLITGSTDFMLAELVLVVSNFIWAFGSGLLLFYALDKVIGIRVSRAEEMKGLDECEHGAIAYPEAVTMNMMIREE
ncbi:MAG: ammonium transporter [Candidatus Methanomethylophilaceae archaeon]